jgi:hypothetical protein
MSGQAGKLGPPVTARLGVLNAGKTPMDGCAHDASPLRPARQPEGLAAQ